ncbi:MAG TPA: 50S ribosomal protein L30 [archaeon]|nr:50S ribosomal protein L30 [archaeon]
MSKRLKITQIKSGVGALKKQRATLWALKLTHHQKSVTHNDTPQIRGMLFKVRHLVQVEEVD